jgi:hypothetical protein
VECVCGVRRVKVRDLVLRVGIESGVGI